MIEILKDQENCLGSFSNVFFNEVINYITFLGE